MTGYPQRASSPNVALTVIEADERGVTYSSGTAHEVERALYLMQDHNDSEVTK
jgi:hypothetical protein